MEMGHLNVNQATKKKNVSRASLKRLLYVKILQKLIFQKRVQQRFNNDIEMNPCCIIITLGSILP